jgi:hypothetical protein
MHKHLLTLLHVRSLPRSASPPPIVTSLDDPVLYEKKAQASDAELKRLEKQVEQRKEQHSIKVETERKKSVHQRTDASVQMSDAAASNLCLCG